MARRLLGLLTLLLTLLTTVASLPHSGDLTRDPGIIARQAGTAPGKTSTTKISPGEVASAPQGAEKFTVADIFLLTGGIPPGVAPYPLLRANFGNLQTSLNVALQDAPDWLNCLSCILVAGTLHKPTLTISEVLVTEGGQPRCHNVNLPIRRTGDPNHKTGLTCNTGSYGFLWDNLSRYEHRIGAMPGSGLGVLGVQAWEFSAEYTFFVASSQACKSNCPIKKRQVGTVGGAEEKPLTVGDVFKGTNNHTIPDGIPKHILEAKFGSLETSNADVLPAAPASQAWVSPWCVVISGKLHKSTLNIIEVMSWEGAEERCHNHNLYIRRNGPNHVTGLTCRSGAVGFIHDDLSQYVHVHSRPRHGTIFENIYAMDVGDMTYFVASNGGCEPYNLSGRQATAADSLLPANHQSTVEITKRTDNQTVPSEVPPAVRAGVAPLARLETPPIKAALNDTCRIICGYLHRPTRTITSVEVTRSSRNICEDKYLQISSPSDRTRQLSCSAGDSVTLWTDLSKAEFRNGDSMIIVQLQSQEVLDWTYFVGQVGCYGEKKKDRRQIGTAQGKVTAAHQFTIREIFKTTGNHTVPPGIPPSIVNSPIASLPTSLSTISTNPATPAIAASQVTTCNILTGYFHRPSLTVTSLFLLKSHNLWCQVYNMSIRTSPTDYSRNLHCPGPETVYLVTDLSRVEIWNRDVKVTDLWINAVDVAEYTYFVASSGCDENNLNN